MFYHTLVLGRKGPLAKVWLAATYRKKLSKKDIINVNVAESVEAILCSRVLMSLRLSSHLLYGISYLFNQQVSYLLSDALEYAYHVPQFTGDQGIDLVDQSTRDINLSDDALDYELIPVTCGTSEFKIINTTKTRILGDLSEVISEEFESLDVLRDDQLLNESIHTDEILFEDKVYTDDGFGGNLDQDPTTIFDIHAPSTSKASKKLPGFTDQSQETVQDEPQVNVEKHQQNVSDNIAENIENLGAGPEIVVDLYDLPTQPAPEVQADDTEQPSVEALNVDNIELVAGPSMEEARRPSTSRYSRLALNDEELVLEPLDESHKRAKRKKAEILLIDQVTSIPRDRMMGNFRDGSETSGRDRAPSTKFLMMTKAKGTDTVLLSNPSAKYVSSIALALFKSCLRIESDDNDDDLILTQDANPTDAAPDQEIPQEELPSVVFEEEINVDAPLPYMPEEPIPEAPVIEREKVIESEPTIEVGLKEPIPGSQSSQPSQERGSQRRRKRRRLSQEQARRGTIYEPELLPRESIIEFEKTHMDVDPPQEVPLFSQSQSEFSSAPDDGLLSQLSQSLSEPVTFSHLTQDCNRKKAALTFFQLLALHKRCVIILEQEQYYEEIFISKGPNFRGTLDVY